MFRGHAGPLPAPPTPFPEGGEGPGAPGPGPSLTKERQISKVPQSPRMNINLPRYPHPIEFDSLHLNQSYAYFVYSCAPNMQKSMVYAQIAHKPHANWDFPKGEYITSKDRGRGGG